MGEWLGVGVEMLLRVSNWDEARRKERGSLRSKGFSAMIAMGLTSGILRSAQDDRLPK